MAKDPAVLFYTSDFLTGTMMMSDDQVGKYIKLLCIQHQKGALTEKDMLKICITRDEDIFSKFEKIGEQFTNKRMRDEAEKRKNYSLSRANNRKKKEEDIKDISNTHVPHMENENENKDIIINNKNEKENFEKARKLYPGDKRGLDTEFANFIKKHKDWKEVVDTLEEKIKMQISVHALKTKQGVFVKEWKMFQTWINNRSWEEETSKPKPTAAGITGVGNVVDKFKNRGENF